MVVLREVFFRKLEVILFVLWVLIVLVGDVRR